MQQIKLTQEFVQDLGETHIVMTIYPNRFSSFYLNADLYLYFLNMHFHFVLKYLNDSHFNKI